MLLDELARELVDVTSALVGGRTINVMNLEGIIVASTERSRIGSFHKGAWEAIRTGRVVNIRKDQLSSYPGAREGCNMPIKVNGAVIGAVGIYGDPDEIQDIAQLLDVYAEKYYQMEAMLRPRLSEMTLRSQLLMHLLSPSSAVMTSARSLMESLQIQVTFPVYTAVISEREGLTGPDRLESLSSALSARGFLEKHCDIWGLVSDRMVLVLSTREGRCPEQLLEIPDPENGWRISLGEPCSTLLEVRQAYEQASALDRCCTGAANDIRQIPVRCKYLFSRMAGEQDVFLEGLYGKLTAAYGPEECSAMLQTMACYYDCDHSVGTAAQKLYIHKNTLQYRVRRVLQALEIEKLSPFYQEFLVRMLLEHLQRKPRS